MIYKSNTDQYLESESSSQITTLNSLGGLIFFEGFQHINRLSHLNDYPFLD